MVKRKLTTIFAADVDGYSRLMGEDEHSTLERLKEYREAITAFIERHHGRVVSWSGDGLLSEFVSVVEAVQCAVEIQRDLKARNDRIDEPKRMNFRIGINLGDVMVEDHDIFGEGVNIAARLQTLAPPGGILISGPVYEQVKSRLTLGFSFLGERQVKNIAGQVAVYGVELMPGDAMSMRVQPQSVSFAMTAPPVVETRRGGLLRRGLALAVDYVIAVAIALPIAILIENAWNDSIEIDVPFISFGTDRVIQQGQPYVVEQTLIDEDDLEKWNERLDQFGARIELPKNAQIVRVDAVIERDIFGLVKHTYRGHDIQEVVLGVKKFDPNGLEVTDLELVDDKTYQPIDRPPLGIFVGLIMILYFAFLESSSLQGSIGKRMLGLKVRDAKDQAGLTFFQALGRALVKVISVVPLFWIAMLNKRRRAVHDMLADSVVVQEK
jgi:class 3 adenylate cyclase/uncharacterized RDD family membrane protein YckC